VIGADGTVAVVPTTDTLGLWPDALDALGLNGELGAVIRPGLAKRAVPASCLTTQGAAPGGTAGDSPAGDSAAEDRAAEDRAAGDRAAGLLADLPVPVDMVVLVRASNHEALGAVAYSGFKAVTAVGRSGWHHDIALALHDTAGHFSWATALATGTRIVRLTLPRRGDPVAAADLVAGIVDGTVEVAPA
jgi:hypothetical protein